MTDLDSIIVVSGLPRSGTSLTMKMLEAGGLEIVTDRLRQADEDNPKGYYEFEPVKKLKEDHSWLDGASGKVVKVISFLMRDLPADHHYRVLFMRRKVEEVLASQKQMLIRRGEPTDKVSDEELARLYEKHLRQVEAWLAAQSNFSVLYVDYNELLREPSGQLERIGQFLGGAVDVPAMAAVIDPALYRQRQ